MIASLRGIVQFKYAARLIVEVHGVGYEVFIPESALLTAPAEGQEVFLHIYAHIREDAFLLFGFFVFAEKQAFQLLISVSGVGPKLALAILSALSPAELGGAIASDDLGRLTNISGVGKKTAERLCLELKGKIDFIPAPGPVVPAKGDQDAQAATALFDDGVSALVNLGYPAAQAREAVAGISALRAGQVSLEELIRLALRSLAS